MFRRCGVKTKKVPDQMYGVRLFAEAWAVDLANGMAFKFNSKHGRAIRRGVKDREFREAIEAASEAGMLARFLQDQG